MKHTNSAKSGLLAFLFMVQVEVWFSAVALRANFLQRRRQRSLERKHPGAGFTRARQPAPLGPSAQQSEAVGEDSHGQGLPESRG